MCARDSNRPARVLRRVAVVREHADVGLGRLVHVADELVQLGELVLRERLGRKQIQGAARRVRQDRVERGRVVTQRLARRGRRRHDEVAAGERELEGRGLVRVELCDAARFERRAQTGIDERGPLGVLRVRGGQRPNRRDPGVGIVGPAGADGAESLEGAREGLLARSAGGLSRDRQRPRLGRASRQQLRLFTSRHLRSHGQGW